MEQDPEFIKKMQSELEQARKEAEENLKGWQRAKADYINRQKEFEIRASQVFDQAERRSVETLLEVLDELETAFTGDVPHNQWSRGIKNIYDKLRSTLDAKGVRAIQSLHQQFDPHYHEAIQIVDAKNKEEDNIIVEEIKKGYALGGIVLKPSIVKVAKFKQ